MPALAALVMAVAVSCIVCGRSTLRRLPFARSLIALTGSVALLWTLAPARAPLALRQAERDDAISRVASSEHEGPRADRASQLLTRM